MTVPGADVGVLAALFIWPVIGIFGWIIGAIIGVVKAVAGAAVRTALFIWPVIAKVASTLWTGVNYLRNAVFGYARHLVNFGVFVWEHALEPLIGGVLKVIERLQSFLHRVLDPVLRVLRRVQEVFDRIWRDVLAPIFRVFEVSRAILRFLALLGVDWAARLEAFLARLEEKIFQTFQTLRSTVNNIITYLDEILDPLGFIKRRLFLSSFSKYINAVVGISIAIGVRRDPRPTTRQLKTKHKLTELSADIEMFLRVAREPTPAMREAAALFRTNARYT